MRTNRVFSRSASGLFLPPLTTHEGAPATQLTPEQQLRRAVMANLLFEDTFYESGKEVGQRIWDLVPQVEAHKVAQIAIDARQKMHLRHVPLAIVNAMTTASADHKRYVGDVLPMVIQRADELAEFLALYFGSTHDRKKNAKDKSGHALSAQVKKGLARAFAKFDAFQLAKYNQDKGVKLRDVMFLAHPKPVATATSVSKFTETVAKQLAENTLPTPDTWETALSATKGENKRAEWERLLTENKLGALALIRNLRNFTQTGVDEDLVRTALKAATPDKVLPFRFISAVRYGPTFAPELEQLMLKNLDGQPKLTGKTALIVDCSGSMDGVLSAKSEMSRKDVAAGLAVLARELCEKVTIYVFGSTVETVPSYRGLGLAAAITKFNLGGTDHALAVKQANKTPYDRIIILTDEQSYSALPAPLPGTKAYMINIATYKNGIGYERWTHIDGWSEQVLNYIRMFEEEYS